MPFTITPVTYIQAFFTTQDFRANLDPLPAKAMNLWLLDVRTALDDVGVITYTSRGSISTTRSIIEGCHNCDNLQLDGEALDLTALSGWSYRPTYTSRPELGESLFFPYAGSFVSVDIISYWGKSDRFTFYNPVSKQDVIVVVWSNLDGVYFSFAWPISDRSFSTMYFDVYIWKILRYPSGECYYQCTSRSINVYGHLCNVATLDNLVMPNLLRYIPQINWSTKVIKRYKYPNTYTAAGNFPITTEYRVNEEEWLTALLKYTEIKYDFGELHYRAISKIDAIDVNGLAYLSDLKKILEDIKSLISLLSGKATLHSISSAYIAYKYGMRLTIADTREYVDAIHCIKRSGVSATDKWLSSIGSAVSCTSTIRYKNRDGVFEDIYQFFRYLDLLVSPENLWDLIPYSFVVDWFVDIGGILSRLDQLDLITHLNIDEVYDSYTSVGTVQASTFCHGIVGLLQFKRYKRHCHQDASFPLIVPQQPSITSHWLEGAALIIQKLH